MKYLIADSGGTQTDWCFVDEEGKRFHFSTESYHPTNWNLNFINRVKEFWEKHDQMFDAELFFFGAGCYSSVNAVKMKFILKESGFQIVYVSSDLHGAGLALFGKNNGWGAILGTGSVLFEWCQKEVTRLVGGKGHEAGDEGSGYYFGKLVYQAFLDQQLTHHQQILFLNNVDTDQLKLNNSLISQKNSFASIAKSLGDEKSFLDFHRENMRHFCALYLSNLEVTKIGFVGSYAFHQRDLLREVLAEFGVDLILVIEKPIERIVDQIVSSID